MLTLCGDLPLSLDSTVVATVTAIRLSLRGELKKSVLSTGHLMRKNNILRMGWENAWHRTGTHESPPSRGELVATIGWQQSLKVAFIEEKLGYNHLKQSLKATEYYRRISSGEYLSIAVGRDANAL